MSELPDGTVTFLFTDLEASTRLWEQHPAAMRVALARHDEILRTAIEEHQGHVVKTTGDGVHAAFATAPDAIAAAVDAQLALTREAWETTGALRVRMGLHTGDAERRGGDYFGTVLNRAARLMAAAHGGQVVCSRVTGDLVRDTLPEGESLFDLGEHRLRDLGRPERVFQLRHPALPADFPPLRSLDHFPGELPVVLTSFVGRERELDSVVGALSESHIVTVLGVGGVGKTRLALQAAAAALPAYEDGAWFCELASITDRGAVPEVVAACLGVGPQPGESLTTSVLAFLRTKQLLLVLDNCEHVIASAGSLAEAIAHACPRVAVLATSREALGVDGEVLRPVGPLDLPDEGAPAAELANATSVQLFADRALAVRPDFTLEAQNAPVVADICRQLDGVPLAIELAAARVSSMTVDEIERRLDQRFRLLTGGRRTALERHQTLRAAVDWSYELLEEIETQAFNRLAVFAGGATLAAAEAVVSGEGIEADDVLDVLSRLVARSMVVADDSAGVTRYRLLETMRQYARERLDSIEESDLIRRRHAEYYVALAEAVDVGLRGRDEARWLRTMDAEFANFRAAFDWALGIGDVDLALRLTVALGRFGVPRPRYTVWRWIELVSDMPEARDHPLRPQAMAFGAVDVVVASGGPALLADRVAKMDAAFADAGLELTTYAVWAHSTLAAVTGRPDEAIEQGAIAVQLALASGDPHAASLHGSMLSMFLTTYGETQRAVERAEAAFALGSELGNPTLLAVSEVALGYALAAVDPQRARVHLEAGVSRSRLVENDMTRSIGERKLAEILAAAGDLIGALATYLAVLEHAMEFGVRLPVALTCRSIAVDLAAAGYHDVAATMFGALESRLYVDQGNLLLWREAAIERLQRAMGATNFDHCAARGREMDDATLPAFVAAALTRIIAELRGC